jgi:hypothetical protein
MIATVFAEGRVRSESLIGNGFRQSHREQRFEAEELNRPHCGQRQDDRRI